METAGLQLASRTARDYSDMMAERVRESVEGRGPHVRDSGILVLIGAAYFATHQLAFLFPSAKTTLMAVWPAGGVGLAGFLLLERRLWPWLLPIYFAAGVSADVLMAGRALLPSMGYMTANVAESLLCALAIRAIAGRSPRFDRVAEVLALFLAAFIVNGLTAGIGAGAAVLAGADTFFSAWLSWWISDGLGILIVTPLIVTWSRGGHRELAPAWKALAFPLFLAAWTLLAWAAFFPVSLAYQLRPYMLFVLGALPAIVFGPALTSASVSVLCFIALAATRIHPGFSPWGSGEPIADLLATQFFLGLVAASVYLLAAAFAERRASERDLKEREAQSRLILDTAMDAFWLLDGNGILKSVTPPASRMLGYTAEEMIGRHVSFFEARETPEEAAEHVGRVAAAGQDRFETMHRRKDGKPIDVEISVTSNPKGDSQYAFIRDITERTRADGELRAKTEELDRYFTDSLDLLCIADTDGYFRRLNKEWESVLGYPTGELLGKRFIDWVHPDDRASTLAALATLGRQHIIASFENRYRTRSGDYRWIEWRSTPSGAAIYAVARDVTERKAAEAALRSALAEKETLLRELYHRTKNNMGVIISLLELQSLRHEDPTVKSALSVARDRVRSMALVHQKLYQAKDLSCVNLREYIADLAGLLLTT